MIKKCLFLCLIFISSIMALNQTLKAQEFFDYENELSDRSFFVDYSFFKGGSSDQINLEIYYKIYNSGLQYVKLENMYQAQYELSVIIKDNHNKQVDAISVDRTLTLYSYSATMSTSDYRISQLNHPLNPGKYNLEFYLTDKNTGFVLKRTLRAEIPQYKGHNPKLSGIELIHKVDTSIVDSIFQKGNIAIIPIVNKEFSGDSAASLLYYFEIYPGNGKYKDYTIINRIISTKMITAYTDTLNISLPDETDVNDRIRQIRRVSLKDIKSGSYYLQMSIIGRRNKILDKVETRFDLYWTPEAMVLYDYENAILQLKYIADPGQIKNLRKIEGKENRLQAWNDFWVERDPKPETPINEAKVSYYQRVDYANRNFGVFRKRGWQTDRGMVFIQYGKPDQIEDFPFELNSVARQVWHYYYKGQPRQFVFVDEWGDGDFRLLYPYDGRTW
ncbi:MAG: GWxTD domain-containing protein [Candidatus Zixiibacteriota bacterium]